MGKERTKHTWFRLDSAEEKKKRNRIDLILKGRRGGGAVLTLEKKGAKGKSTGGKV